MPGVKIRGGEHPLREVFSDEYVFEIPPYQRAYAWTTEEVGELLDDLWLAVEESQEGDPTPYFLGSIVLAKDEGRPASQVIDGQQRLTTLTILLSALADRLGDEHGMLWQYVQQRGNRYAGIKDAPRVTLRQRDAIFFRNYIQTPGALAKLEVQDPAQLNDACRNILTNALYVRDRLAGEPTDRLDELAMYLVQHCYLIVVSTPDSESAFRIFAVLNDRGLDLTHADIIKNELIGRIDSERQDEYTHKWEDAEDELGTDQFGELFSHIRMVYAKSKLRSTLLRSFRQVVLDRVVDPCRFIDDVIIPYADVFASLTHQRWVGSHQVEEINDLIRWLWRIDNFDWIPPALRYLRDAQGDPTRVAAFLRALERLAGSMFIRRIGINARIERYARVLRALDEGQDVLAPASVLDLTPEDRGQTLEWLDGDVYSQKRTRVYVLLRLDAALSAGGASYEYARTTVEHVLPQRPSPDSEWWNAFNAREQEQWINRLANLVLLDRYKNSSASNRAFELKKRTYFTKDNHTSPFALTSQVLATDTWTPAVLETRQRMLLEHLADLWELHPAEMT